MVQTTSSCLSKWPVHLWFFWILMNFTHTHTDTQVHLEVSLPLFPSFPMVVPKCFNSQLRTKNQDHWKPLDLKNGLRIMVYSTKTLGLTNGSSQIWHTSFPDRFNQTSTSMTRLNRPPTAGGSQSVFTGEGSADFGILRSSGCGTLAVFGWISGWWWLEHWWNVG